eukprot:gnl/TRDRNA2_/TRDRNA2_177223_c8_seq7.p1 gnl/TRDRNA2_/TRDRNA2_177223_c8~~gnl/TRDRNA2_/TRDRNA2_177223_c8_seq7.p1  ORF type:complete len:284 (+),score=32.56 gnl/TRDRNA2_/TRDRNA2_177223_c8_seq7:95-946(+)
MPPGWLPFAASLAVLTYKIDAYTCSAFFDQNDETSMLQVQVASRRKSAQPYFGSARPVSVIALNLGSPSQATLLNRRATSQQQELEEQTSQNGASTHFGTSGHSNESPPVGKLDIALADSGRLNETQPIHRSDVELPSGLVYPAKFTPVQSLSEAKAKIGGAADKKGDTGQGAGQSKDQSKDQSLSGASGEQPGIKAGVQEYNEAGKKIAQTAKHLMKGTKYFARGPVERLTDIAANIGLLSWSLGGFLFRSWLFLFFWFSWVPLWFGWICLLFQFLWSNFSG